jgi:hypothetical protein
MKEKTTINIKIYCKCRIESCKMGKCILELAAIGDFGVAKSYYQVSLIDMQVCADIQ